MGLGQVFQNILKSCLVFISKWLLLHNTNIAVSIRGIEVGYLKVIIQFDFIRGANKCQFRTHNTELPY